MIYQNGKGAIAIVESAETVGNAGHFVAVDAVARREQGFGIDMRIAAEQIWRLRTGGPLDLVRNDELVGMKV